MASPVTKDSYVDNWYSEKEGYVEVGYKGKKAFIEKGSLEILNPDNIPLDIKAMIIGVEIADEDNCWETTKFSNFVRTQHDPMTYEEARRYLEKQQNKKKVK